MSQTKEMSGFEEMRSRVSYVNGERRADTADFSWKKILIACLIVWGAYIGFMALCSIGGFTGAPASHRRWEEKVAANAVLSSLSDGERATLAKVLKTEFTLDDSNLLVGAEVEPPATREGALRGILSIAFHPIALILVAVVAMYVMMLRYYCNICDEYFLADFPEVKPGKWLLPILTCAAFPFYLFSWYRMCRWKAWRRERGMAVHDVVETQGEADGENQAETQDESTAEDESSEAEDETPDEPFSYEDLETSLAFQDSPQAKALFTTFCNHLKQESWCNQFAESCKRVEAAKSKFAMLRDKADRAQAELRRIEAQHAELASIESESGFWPDSLESLVEDWQEITQLPGVTSVKVVPGDYFGPEEDEAKQDEVSQGDTSQDAVDAEHSSLQILVKARYELGSDVYDLGDWLIVISDCAKKYECAFVRTGRRDGDVEQELYVAWYTSDKPVFCFGDKRTEDIQAYLENGQIVAAVNLMVNSLHTPKEEDLEFITNEYKRVLPVSCSE